MKPPKATTKIDLSVQSIEISNSDGARLSALSPDGVTGMIYDDAKTLPQVMERGCRLSNNGPCLGWRGAKPEYNWITYSEVIERAGNLAAGLVHIGMKPGQTTFVGIYSQNCVEWILAEYACYNQSAVVVPLYDTLGPTACSYIINQTEMSLVVCDKEEKARSLLSTASETPSLKTLLVICSPSKDIESIANEKGIEVYSFKDVEVMGKKNPSTFMFPESDDLATICYTSGTTGDPKGVMLTHANMISTACAVNLHFGKFAPNKTDTFISFLPLAHMMERSNQLALYIEGGRVGFWRGDINLLMEDMQALQPTLMAAVPRLLNKIYDKVFESANSSKLKKLLLNVALNRKIADLKRSAIRNDTIWDKLVFKKIRNSLGGRLKLFVNGAAPLSESVINFVRCSFGCMVCEGYGQTETSAPCAISTPGDVTPCQVGPPLPCCLMKVVDVPEMGYLASRGEGEVCIKGSNVFKGYYKLPEKTSEALDSDGWLHTGDIGVWLPNGTLKLIDRKKHIFKLSQGEYIAPEKIENIYLRNKFVDQIFVYGDSLKSCLVGIIVPDKGAVETWCKENNIEAKWDEICSSEVVNKKILSEMTALGKISGLKSFEQVKAIHLHPEPFTFENGFLTPTSKVKRPICKKHFIHKIEQMYKNLP